MVRPWLELSEIKFLICSLRWSVAERQEKFDSGWAGLGDPRARVATTGVDYPPTSGYICGIAERNPPPDLPSILQRRFGQNPEPSARSANTPFSRECGWGWLFLIRAPHHGKSDVFFSYEKGDEDAVTEIYHRIDREFAAEEARADRLLRLYGL